MTPSSSSTELTPQIEELFLAEGASQVGVARLEKPLSLEIYREWLNKDFHGDMQYLKDHLPLKTNPQLLLPRAKTALVASFPYFPEPFAHGALKHTRLAFYAKNLDYHQWIKKKLNSIISTLQRLYPDHDFLAMSDSHPVLERDLAQRAGLGWIGKNTCLIHPKRGSLFFISEIYTTLEFQADQKPMTDHCGTCTRCMDVCPTGAIVQARELDARKCISYLTIEYRKLPPVELRTAMGDWFFGCDLCQTVCPWNLKWNDRAQLDSRPTRELNDSHARDGLIKDLCYILETSNRSLAKDLAATPLARAGGVGLKRNALIVIANLKLVELKHQVELLHDHSRLGDLARWCLNQLTETQAT